MEGYYKKLLEDNKIDKIQEIRNFIMQSRLPESVIVSVFDFLYFGEGGCVGDWNDHPVLNEICLKLEREARQRHVLSDKEMVLFYRKRKDKVTFVITDYGLSWKNNTGDHDWGDEFYYIPWECIHRVEYNESTQNIEFYSSPSKKPFDIHYVYVLAKTQNEEKARMFADILTNIARCFYIDKELLYNKLSIDNVSFDEKLKECDTLLSLCVDFNEGLNAIYRKVAILLAEYKKTREEKHLDLAETILENIPIYEDSKLAANEDKIYVKPKWAKIEHRLTEQENEKIKDKKAYFYKEIASIEGDWRAKRKNIIRLLGSDNFQSKRDLIKQLDEIESGNLWDNYTSLIGYQERRLIMPLRDISGCISQNIEVFRIGKIPSSIHFLPTCQPIEGMLYIGNPTAPGEYIPIEGHEFEFLMRQVDEYCWILQCLGAEEITIRTIKGKSVSNAIENNSHLDGSLGLKGFNVSVEEDKEQKNTNEQTSRIGIELIQKFHPQTKPYLPGDLVWYESQPTWQSKVKQRLAGNLIEFSQRFSTQQTSMVSKSETTNIKAEAEYIWAKANINNKETQKAEFKSAEDTEWIVTAKFKPLQEFEEFSNFNEKSSKVSTNEEKYKEEVLFYLEDNGSITDIERRFLEKKRVRLGVSEERAKEIEEDCLPKLTSEEKEYIEALKELGDADMQNLRIRRMLDHERDDLGISEERALELEKQYCDQ